MFGGKKKDQRYVRRQEEGLKVWRHYAVSENARGGGAVTFWGGDVAVVQGSTVALRLKGILRFSGEDSQGSVHE